MRGEFIVQASEGPPEHRLVQEAKAALERMTKERMTKVPWGAWGRFATGPDSSGPVQTGPTACNLAPMRYDLLRCSWGEPMLRFQTRPAFDIAMANRAASFCASAPSRSAV